VNPPAQPIHAGPAESRAERVPPAALRLRHAREQAGLSLDVLVLRTKINRRMLEAVEAMNLEGLPATTYTRGFVMAYAREVGLDPEATATAYLAEVEETRGSHAPATPVAPPPPVRVRIADLNRDVSGIGGVIVMVACAVALIVYVWAVSGRNPNRTAAPLVAAAPEAAVAAEPAAAPPDAVPATAEPLTAIGQGPFRVELQADRECWISATVDGRLVLARLLKAGERETLEASEIVTLRVGEPGALRYSINGRPGEPLGRPGQPVTVRITPANAHEFIS
jgi:cytoskeletal protein RodZ